MEDLERYGDYTEYEDDIPKGKRNPVILVLKILIALICISVIGIFAFRLIVFNYYPDSVSNIYFTSGITEYYKATDGQIGAKTQELRAPYDNPDYANFFCDNLIVVENIGELQISLRHNNAAIEEIKAKLGLENLDPESEKIFTFRLYDNYNNTYDPIHVSKDSFLMYTYYKICFDGIPFKTNDGIAPEWIRLEVFVEGQSGAEPFSKIPIYENNVDFSEFKDYNLSGEERPQ